MRAIFCKVVQRYCLDSLHRFESVEMLKAVDHRLENEILELEF